MKRYDVVVIGGGHAGSEAAAAASRMGARTALITRKKTDIGVMSCNPAIGGVGKGHLVCECDALDGLMGRATDLAAIQFRTLNRSRGPAVWGPRAQADREKYAAAIRTMIEEQDNLTIIEDEVLDITFTKHSSKNKKRRLDKVILKSHDALHARTAILATGTFLRGVIRIGDWSMNAGRMGDDAAIPLAHSLQRIGLTLGRLKTGTPPRLDGTTIDYDVTTIQQGDENPLFFHPQTKHPTLEQVPCFITHTNEKTHDLIRQAHKNPHRDEEGDMVQGPRYCPSLEEKVTRFPHNSAHTIFLEPEGLNDTTVYPNGLSMSLGKNEQESIIHSIKGLERATIIRHGYSVSYDYVRSHHLDHRLAVHSIEGLFLAGQINGTTGYEEAAAQGLVAGINAAHEAGGGSQKNAFIPHRANSYMGVLIDDLIRHELNEPYRMLTARAEYRLRLRCDNAMNRLTEEGIRMGCIGKERHALWRKMQKNDSDSRHFLQSERVNAQFLRSHDVPLPRDGIMPSLAQLLIKNTIPFDILASHYPTLHALSPSSIRRISIEIFYAPYLKRQESQLALLQKEEQILLDKELNYDTVSGLSTEALSALKRSRPPNLAAASRLAGVTPAALIALMRHGRIVSRETC